MKPAALVIVAFFATACRSADSRAASDSALARDLAMANQATAEPQLKDTALTTQAKSPATSLRKARVDDQVQVQVPRVGVPAKAAPHEPAPAQPTAPTFRGIPAGTTFALATKGAICTTNLPGDKIAATIAADVAGENGAMIPGGSTVVLEVAQVTPGETPESASITLRIRSVIVDDQPVTVPSDISVTSPLERHTLPRDKGADRRKVVGGVVAGAIVGQILGKDTKSTITGAVVGGAAGAATAAATGAKYDACLPAGGTLRATTREPVPLIQRP